ncbi:MAG: Hsp20/alpha crystallin family protein [Sphingobacteriales bacterium JAD_PAG50586_3]|nr:MAG: Hsp20/alpha crystallin family protein [Sphingobacteriales bacterium JAD_PAG50586_3]
MTLVKFKKNAPADFMSSFLNDVWSNEFVPANRAYGRSVPAVNIAETDANFTLHFAAPGFTKEDIKVKVDGDTLTVSGEVKAEATETKENFKRREFYTASFNRSFTLPDIIEGEKIEGKYENGIITVVLPKKAAESKNTVREISLN